VLMLNGGGRAIEDIREIKIDEGLRELLCAWLRRMGKGAKVWFFSMERMPSSFFKANAIFFRIGCLAYNLFRIFQLNILPKGYKKIPFSKNQSRILGVVFSQ